MNHEERQARLLLGTGSLLFLLGLVTGLAMPATSNPRMGLAAHLEGVTNGMLLLLIGLAWSKLTLSARSRTVTFWTLLYGTCANWLFVTCAALWGASSLMPIAGAGYQALPWQEKVVLAGLTSVGIAMLVAGTLLTWGFFRKPGQESPPGSPE